MKEFCPSCQNDPVTHQQQKEICVICDMETKVAKRKITNLDRIRTADIDCLISWFCRGRPCATCPYNGVGCWIRDWLEEEVDE